MVANAHAATAFVSGQGGGGFSQDVLRARPAVGPAIRSAAKASSLWICICLVLMCQPASAASNKVRITNLTDVSFGTISNFASDAIQAESVCLYSDTNTSGYNITATGSGPAGAFQLSSGLSSLAYEVQWSSSAGQASGAQLSSSVPLTGQISSATQQTCNNGPANSASLVVIVRSAALSSAAAGSYSGTLTLVVGPE